MIKSARNVVRRAISVIVQWWFIDWLWDPVMRTRWYHEGRRLFLFPAYLIDVEFGVLRNGRM